LGPRRLRGLKRMGIDTNPAPALLEVHVAGRPVLEDVRLVQQLFEDVVADLPVSLRGPDPRISERPGDRARDGGTDPLAARGVSVRDIELAGQDLADVRMPVALRLLAQVHPDAGRAFESALRVLVREEDERLDIRHWLPLHGGLPRQQALQLLGLAVREQKRVVGLANAVWSGPRPRPGIAVDACRCALD